MYYIYHVPGEKIGCSKYPDVRVADQGFSNYEILEEHTCIYTVSDREIELQKEYGYRVDNVPYFKTIEAQKIYAGKIKGIPKPYLSIFNKETKRKLTMEEADEIRSKYVPRTYSTHMLAKEYGVTSMVIHSIVNNRSYTKKA